MVKFQRVREELEKSRQSGSKVLVPKAKIKGNPFRGAQSKANGIIRSSLALSSATAVAWKH